MENRTEENANDEIRRQASCCQSAGSRRGKPFFYGSGTALAMVGFYLGLITLTSDWLNAKAEFGDYQWWVISLAIGLGVQVGLFTHMRSALASLHMKGAATGVAASGGMSGVAMAVCCSHYLAGILPVIGLPFLSSAVAGLSAYQVQFFAVGLVFNLLGLAFMLRMMGKNGLLPDFPILQQINRNP